jgi:hypothetical protein
VAFIIDDSYDPVVAENVTVKHGVRLLLALDFPSFKLPCDGDEVVGISG